MEEFLLRDQGCPRSANQSNRSSSQRRLKYPAHREDTNPTAIVRALQRRPQPSLHHLRRRHRPTASSGDQRRPRSPSLSPRNHQGRASTLQRKTPGSDAIPAEIYEHGGPQLMDNLTALVQEMWRQVPQDFKDATIIHLYKRKGDRQIRDSHRDGASTPRCHDGASHRQWSCLRGIQTNGVKQGCVLAPTLFSLMFSAMLMDAYRDEHPGIRIAYRTDGHLLNHRRAHFQSRASATAVHEFLFADDCALNTTSEGDMQRGMDLIVVAWDKFGLVINTEKTAVTHQSPPNAAYVAS
ncbi:hypothetical protein SprV_0301185400 [Sparganum proliferum]